jgi:predicted enzyme related to lactoylglutathione lyase
MAKSRFVWHDFMAADVDGAKRFYGELFGWTFKPGEHGYNHIESKGAMIGGILGLADEQRKVGVPPHWIGYVEVDDCDAAVARVRKAGGQVYHQEAMETVGRFAICADPQGATFSPFQPARASAPESTDRTLRWRFCWDELLTPDAETAARFYRDVFGWGAEHLDMGPAGKYTLLKRTGEKDETGADKNAGGILPMPPGAPHPPFWLTYVSVDDADAVCEKAKRLGATIMRAPADIPDVGRFAVLMDAQHGSFAVLQPKT